MGSHPTLDDHELAAEAHELDSQDWRVGHVVVHLAADHPQVQAWPDDNPYLAHDQDHRDWIYDHHYPSLTRLLEAKAERAFDRLNPQFGVPADQHNPYGRQAVRDREAALALGVRVAVHDSRQNDPSAVVWQPGQDYRIADALHAARHQPTRTRRRRERVGPER